VKCDVRVALLAHLPGNRVDEPGAVRPDPFPAEPQPALTE